jgi:hypothetical protein
MLPSGAVVGGQNARAIVQLSCGMPFLPAISSANFTTYMSPFVQQMAETVRSAAALDCALRFFTVFSFFCFSPSDRALRVAAPQYAECVIFGFLSSFS